MHFGIGDVPKAPTATRFKPILTLFTILLGWRLAAGAFFLTKNEILWEKNNFLIAFLAQKATATGLKKWSLAYKMFFLLKKRRLRQHANRGKW